MTKLLSHSSAKLDKSQNNEWLNAIMYLEPSYDYKSVCKNSTASCRKNCLVFSGMMHMNRDSRMNRTALYFENRDVFDYILIKEIKAFIKKAHKQGKKPALRLNGTSDLNFDYIYKMFPEVQFYEYTAVLEHYTNKLDNVHVTFSRKENTTLEEIDTAIKQGLNVSVIFEDVPQRYLGYRVKDGDTDDRRFEDDQGYIIGLKYKGSKANMQKAINQGLCIAA